MLKHRKTIALIGLVAVFLGAYTLRSRSGVDCAAHAIDIVNRSSKTIRVTEIRWLETTQEKWLDQQIDRVELPAGSTWQVEVNLAGLQIAETYLIARYQILRDPEPRTWSEVKSTSQRRVASCVKTRRSDIHIVDLRASLLYQAPAHATSERVS